MLSLRWLYIQLKCAHHTIDVTIIHHASKIFMREYVSLFFTRIPQSKIVYLLLCVSILDLQIERQTRIWIV